MSLFYQSKLFPFSHLRVAESPDCFAAGPRREGDVSIAVFLHQGSMTSTKDNEERTVLIIILMSKGHSNGHIILASLGDPFQVLYRVPTVLLNIGSILISETILNLTPHLHHD